jgi:hypothetical protein
MISPCQLISTKPITQPFAPIDLAALVHFVIATLNQGLPERATLDVYVSRAITN